MKRTPEVVYVRTGYTPMRAPKVSPNSLQRAHGHFSSRAPALIKGLREAGRKVDRALVQARAAIQWRAEEERRVVAEKEHKSLVCENRDLEAQYREIQKRLKELEI